MKVFALFHFEDIELKTLIVIQICRADTRYQKLDRILASTNMKQMPERKECSCAYILRDSLALMVLLAWIFGY
jgi:hypothetical protein